MSDTVEDEYDTCSARTDPTDHSSSEITVGVGDDAWVVERSTGDAVSLGVGDAVRFSKPMTATDVAAFAQGSGDTNPLHLEAEIAEQTRFDGRIVHGTLVAGTISAALARLPGVVIYLSQDLEFLAPVEIGQTVTADCEIVEAFDDGRYRLRTTVETDDGTVIDGEAVVLVSEAPDPDSETPA